MASISRVKPGQVLYTVMRQKAGNTTMYRTAVHPVRVIEVDPEGRYVVASWNYNPARKYYESAVRRWKVKQPEKDKVTA